jgi:hypothetical protein
MCASIIIVSFSNIYTASNFGVSSFLSLSRHHEKDHTQIPEREPNNMAYTPMLPFPASRHSAIVLGELLALSIENLQHFWLNLPAAMRYTFTSMHTV